MLQARREVAQVAELRLSVWLAQAQGGQDTEEGLDPQLTQSLLKSHKHISPDI